MRCFLTSTRRSPWCPILHVTGSIQVAFGGEARLQLLIDTLEELRSHWRCELYIVSFAEKDTIVRTLSLLGALSLFGEANIFGWQEMGGPFVSKGDFVGRFISGKGWPRKSVLFLDDQPDNIRSVEPFCACYLVHSKGLTEEDLLQLQEDSGVQLARGFAAGVVRSPAISSGRSMRSHDSLSSFKSQRSMRSELNLAPEVPVALDAIV
eukprot:TRINITY_DN15335_c0_g1_i1.p1 TRINITY_DN15335_c0_g1~~TRINITY_DN15335_c0_g1_i1.p1  ORF type:complete len:208 (-),score=27.86 TRINITY_DN15335_c0_g1_i1:634-1257(-)